MAGAFSSAFDVGVAGKTSSGSLINQNSLLSGSGNNTSITDRSYPPA